MALSSGSSLQDTLRLLTLWFKYGYQERVNAAIAQGFLHVNIDTWLQVIPQLIARIDAPSPLVRRQIDNLLTDIGKQHPQALIYSLTVASKSLIPRVRVGGGAMLFVIPIDVVYPLVSYAHRVHVQVRLTVYDAWGMGWHSDAMRRWTSWRR